MPRAGNYDPVKQLNKSMPAARDAQLGTTLAELIDVHNDLRSLIVALLTKLDGANLAGMGNNNVATLSPTLPPLGKLGTRTFVP